MEHKRRVETRSCEIENLKLPEWKEVENREYHPWKKERIVVDTANRSIEVCVKELFNKIELCLNPRC